MEERKTKERMFRWTLDGNLLHMNRYIGKDADDKPIMEMVAEFDFSLIYPTFAEMTEVQKYGISYGFRQILSDKGANEVGDPIGKIKTAKSRWDDLLAGKITGERINATGRAEDKKAAAGLKAEAQVVSMEGLMAKKLEAKVLGKVFTAEDQEKLDELMEEYVKQSAKIRGKR